LLSYGRYTKKAFLLVFALLQFFNNPWRKL
jgi:hypothetical protein